MSVETLPVPGLGTFRLKGDIARETVRTALDFGYRHLDTAQIYDNEVEVGEALQQSDVPREEVFLTTKVWYTNLKKPTFKDSVHDSIKRLKTDYLDLLLIHWPSPKNSVMLAEYLQELREVCDAGLTRFIGVSNFNIRQLNQAIDILGKGQILTNQIEVHPFLQNEKVVAHCQQQGVTVTGYMPLAVGKVMEDKTLQRIAAAQDATPAKIVLAWLQGRDIVPIPSSTKEAHLRSNLDTSHIRLSEDEMSMISKLERGERLANPQFAPDWDC